jgi:hypothetical protein
MELMTERVWTELQRSANATRRSSWVAVAYFGKGADRQLRLAPGSRLVVDASLGAVKAGQTHPLSLLRMLRRQVRVYSIENLHAKVYLIGRRAFIGSANASRSSAHRLLEAMLCTSDPLIVSRVREFVRGLCMRALSPEVLRRLQGSYRPPRVGGDQSTQERRRSSSRAEVPPLRVVQLARVEWPESEAELHSRGLRKARARREHRNGWSVQSFRLTGQCRIARGEQAMQVVDEGRGRKLVEPPGTVLNVVHRMTRRGRVVYVYVEVPKVRRRPRALMIAREIGRGARKTLMRDGVVRNQALAQRILKYWSSG